MQNFLGDMITRIRNGQRARLGAIYLHYFTPKLCLKILKILKDEGYILGFQYISLNNQLQIKVLLKYNANGVGTIKSIFQISKPGMPLYFSLVSL